MTRRNSWIRRIIAVGLAAGMVMSTTLPALAERAEGYESSVEAENNFADGDSAASVMQSDSQSKAIAEEIQQETRSGLASEEDSREEIRPGSASEEGSKEQEVQTEAAAEESEQVQLSLELLAEGLEADVDSPSLSLEGADALSDKLNVKENTVEVTDGDGLILLSNVFPAEYSTYTIRLITTTGWDLTRPLPLNGTSYSFLGLGDETHPYEGSFGLDQETAATQYSIATSRSLFNALSTKAQLGKLPFCISEKAVSMQEPLLAGKLISGGADECLTGKIVLRDLNSDKISNPVIGGLIGTMGEGTSADLTFENQLPKELTIRTTSHTGLFCNTMAENTSLTAEFKKASGAGSIKVEATGAGMDAGGFVGHMERDAGLKIAGCSVDQVTSDSGNAGGLVGSVTDGSIQLKEQGTAFSFADTLTVKAESTSAAGGLIGYWLVTKGNTVGCNLSDYQFKKLVISGGQDAGGLFGLLKNTSTAKTAISISANAANTANTMTAEVSGTVTNFGGIIGTYQSDQMDNTLTIKGESDKVIDASTSGGTNVNSSYGGIIGVISENSYVEIENVSATTADMKNDQKASVGGLVGKMSDGLLNVGNVTLNSNNDLASDADNVDGRGGLVGHLVKGVLRLHGSTNLREQMITTAYHHVGQIVGNNDNGLVYALGDGNGLDADESSWSLIRYSDADRGGSDIGNWGAVVRLGDKLSEGNDGVVTFDQDAHTVQVKNGIGSGIDSANAFAAYALAFDLSKAYTGSGSSAALSFANSVDEAVQQTVTLTGDIDLTGTGILGIGKDNIEKGATAQKFAGTLNGSNCTITLDIGTTYGANVSSAGDNAAGQLYAKRSDQRDAHYSLALIPFAGDVTIQNLIIAGTVDCRVPQNVKEEENSGDVRYPAFVSAAIGLASGTTAFENVTVNTKVSVAEEANAEKANAKKLHVWQAGFLGRCESASLTFKNCTWGSESTLIDERSTDNQRIGGLAAEVMGGCNVTVENCTLSGSIISKAKSNARVGGLIAVSRGETQNGSNNSYTSADTTIKIASLQVKEENIDTEAAKETSGGLLGYQWKNTNVVFAASADNIASEGGVTISGATLKANAQFGGLVYQATGYWNATAANSIVFSNGTDNKANTFTGTSTKDAPSGLLVGTGLIKVTQSGEEVVESALYLEAGTWETAPDAAYKIDNDAVTLNIGNAEYFDELVGTTKKDDAGHSNAVVSLAVRDGNGTAERIDIEDTGNTYTGQLSSNYKNGNTRYYYNLDSYRKNNPTLNVDSVTSPENMVLWSVAQYAAVNIRGYFRQGERTDVIITGSIDLKGYSYYPVTPLGAVNLGSNQAATTSVAFDYDGMNAKEANNKPLSDSDHQHYLMQHGLFYHTTHNIAVKNTSFSGTVGKERTADDGTYSSGALIYGSVTGDPVNNIVEISLNNVTLAGIRVAEIANGSTDYAPLLINQMNQAVKLTVNALSTGDGYTTGDGSGKTTAYVASSLIGKVGSATATKLTLSFSNIALDGRLKEETSKSTSVYNNGNVSVDYHTTHTIFTRATLLESFMYSSEGTGTYNFNSTDDKVTYGVELTNAGAIGRNPDKQYQYYDGDSYITDEQGKTANEAYVKSRYGSSNFIRYVYTQQNINESKYELDINQKTTGLLKGCGTYGDPYIIEDAHQLSSLAAYIQNPDNVSKFQVIFNSKVLENQAQTAEGYHLLNGATGTDITYTWENGAWKNEDGSTADKEKATNYLLNAYYKIDKDIIISAENFGGLGTKENPFSGVLVGASKNNTTVALTGTNTNKDSFGGLIAYSRGSVVKDLIVDYSQATITMQADSLPGSSKNPFFGGVVGYCMGGDTIIDHVSVKYDANSVAFSGTYSYMIAAGGYVGLVGGATHVTEDTDYEKTGGGVVFRNMDGTSNAFTTACADAAAANKTVNMVNADGTVDGKKTSDGGKYFYRNPYVGRVLDGYACAEGCTVNNTDKNYTIPTLTAGTGDLQVTDASGSLNVTVNSAQGLWLLSAIVNSGAGAMDANGSYTDVDNQVVDAYQYGKPRTASYEGIGTATADAVNLADEAYWGGVVSTAGSDTAKNRVSYLVKNYTTGNATARLAGKSSTAVNNPVSLAFTANSIDMSSYGNGFRGIGSSYGNNKHVWNKDCSIPEVYRRNLLIKSINTDSTKDTVITLNMNQNDYHTEYSSGYWLNQGAGLFVDFHFTDGCKVNHLKISGNIKLGLFDTNGTLMCVTKRADPEVHIGVGGFAARTANSSGTVTFDHFNLENINVYGGSMTGGAIGYIDGYSGATRNVSFTNWTIRNEKVTKWVYNDGSTGGLVGWNIGYGTLSITGNEDSSVKDVDQLSVTTHAEKYATAAAGGLVGANDYSSVNVENVNAQNLSVSGRNLRDIGGLIAAVRNSDSFNVNKCKLNSAQITAQINNTYKYNNVNTGGIVGYHNRELKISKVTLEKQSSINGQQYTGGFIGHSAGNVEISDCRENSVNIKTDMNWCGGFIGYLYHNCTTVIKNCQENNVNILGRYAGGLVGTNDGNIQASYVEFNNVIAVTNKSDTKCAGLITGNATSTDDSTKTPNKVSGYNILAESCKTGYSSNATVEKLPTAKIGPASDCGLWIGKNGAKRKTTINLTAVAAKGQVFPQKDIGTNNGSATIIYADAFVDQTYQPINSTDKPSSSASPWLDVNPKSEVSFADGTVMTGNGVGMQEGSTTASTILNGLQAETPASDVYWNLLTNKAEFVKFSDTTNDAYVTTYRKEEGSTTTVSEDVDFPVLVVNNTADVDTMIWNYIAAMTNVSSGTDAKQQTVSITAKTYQWDAAKSFFTAKSEGDTSLSISTEKKISIVPNAYDNQSSQFTLLDVTYANPTNEQAEPFHLYIPVLVKKVLYISFKTRFLAGTDYRAADYPINEETTNHYATAGFDEPLTAYIEYSYEKDTDWQSMLDNGENLLWYYDKILDLTWGSTAEAGKTLLPSGTRLTLVDRQTKQYYTYTTTGTEDLHKFDFAKMYTADGTTPFCPVYICDLLDMTVSGPVAEETEGTTYYVVENNPTKATVRVGTTYYRKAEANDKDAGKYRITIDEASKSEARSEGYYLTVQVPKTEGYSVINNRLNYGAISRKEGTLPAKITSDAAQSGSGYVVYNGVEQKFTVSTNRIHNGSETSDTVMENGDSVKIKLQSTLKLTEAGRDRFDKVGPSEFYHRFDVSLKKYLKTLSAGEYDVIGTENVSYTYTLTGNGLNFKKEEKLQNVAGLDTLTLQYGGSELKKALEKAESDTTAVTVTAEITLTYVTADHFPERNTSDSSDSSGMSVFAASAIANTASQLPITTNKLTSEDKNRYYTTNPSRASLEYSAIAGISDATRQLGINPSDAVNSSDTIETKAKYDYSSVDSTVLESAAEIRYTLELFQKDSAGTYSETPLEIGAYLLSMRMEDAGEPFSSLKTSCQWTKSFASNEDRQEFAYIDFIPLTGGAFEAKGYTYANYKVRLTAVLLDQNGNEIDGTKASDYIIYTNACIYQQILEKMQGAAAGNE